MLGPDPFLLWGFGQLLAGIGLVCGAVAVLAWWKGRTR